jgi:hypothetical protein
MWNLPGADWRKPVESHHFKHLDRFEIEFGSHPVDGCRADETELVLDEVQEWQRGRAFARRVMGNAFVGPGFEVCGDFKRREKPRAGSVVFVDGWGGGGDGHRLFDEFFETGEV